MSDNPFTKLLSKEATPQPKKSSDILTSFRKTNVQAKTDRLSFGEQLAGAAKTLHAKAKQNLREGPTKMIPDMEKMMEESEQKNRRKEIEKLNKGVVGIEKPSDIQQSALARLEAKTGEKFTLEDLQPRTYKPKTKFSDFAKALPGNALKITGDIAKEYAKAFIEVPMSLVDTPRVLLGNKPMRNINVPILGEVGSHPRQVIDAINAGEDPLVAMLRVGGESILDVVSVYSLAKSLMPKQKIGATVENTTKAETHQRLLNNQKMGSEIDEIVKVGDMPKSAFYKGDSNVLTEAYSKGQISDVAQKLDFYKQGLGDIYRAKAIPGQVTVDDIVKIGLEVLNTPTTPREALAAAYTMMASNKQAFLPVIAQTAGVGIKKSEDLFTGALDFADKAGNKVGQITADVLTGTADVLDGVGSIVIDKEVRGEFLEAFGEGTLQTAAALQTTGGLLLQQLALEQASSDLFTKSLENQYFFELLAEDDIEIGDEALFSERIKDPKFIARLLGTNLPNMMASMGLAIPAGMIGGPAAAGYVAFGMGGSLEAGFAYNEAISQSVPPEHARKVALFVGVANGLLETLPMGKLFPNGSPARSAFVRELSNRVIKAGVTEVWTESLQEMVANAAAMTYDKERTLFEGIPEAALAAFLTTGILGGTSVVATKTGSKVKELYENQKNIGGKLQEDIIDAVETNPPAQVKEQLQKQFDITPEAAEKMVNDAIEKVVGDVKTELDSAVDLNRTSDILSMIEGFAEQQDSSLPDTAEARETRLFELDQKANGNEQLGTKGQFLTSSEISERNTLKEQVAADNQVANEEVAIAKDPTKKIPEEPKVGSILDVPLDQVESGLLPQIEERINRDDPKIQSLIAAFKKGLKIPAVPVFLTPSGKYQLNKNGNHRLAAYRFAGAKNIPIKIQEKTTLTATQKQTEERAGVQEEKKKDRKKQVKKMAVESTDREAFVQDLKDNKEFNEKNAEAIEKGEVEAKPTVDDLTEDQGFRTEVAKDDEVNRAEAVKTLEAYKKRFKMDFDTNFADVILTGDKVDPTAYAVTYDNSITFVENVTKTTADHEFVHMVAQNLGKFGDLFGGVTRQQLLEEIKQGEVDMTNEDAVIAVEEDLAIGFEDFVSGRKTFKGKVKAFFEKLLSELRKVLGLGNNVNIIRQFYIDLYTKENTGETITLIPDGKQAAITEDRVVDFRKRKGGEKPAYQTKDSDLPKILRGTKGLTADDIMKQHPDIQLKRDVPAKDIHGNKVVIPKGEELTPYELKGNRILLQDGQTYIVTKNQFKNIKSQSIVAEAEDFAPEFEGTEEVIRKEIDDTIYQDEARAAFERGEEVYGVDEDGHEFLVEDPSDIENAFTFVIGDVITPKTVYPKFKQYQLPAGENYREILVQAPQAKGTAGLTVERVADSYQAHDNGEPRGSLYTTRERAEQSLKNVAKFDDIAYQAPYKSPHWQETNVLFHLRMNDRTFEGDKVTFMEELQSDWAKDGRDKGFVDGKVEYTFREDANVWVVKSTDGKAYDVSKSKVKNGAEAIKYVIENKPNSTFNIQGRVPNNPLLKNWQELAVKRALQDAVASDAKHFAWINGAQTSARYNLATQVENVKWEQKGEIKEIKIKPKDNSSVIDVDIDNKGVIKENTGVGRDWHGTRLDEVLGKGLADQIMAEKEGTLSGEGLEFGGEWASNLYDKQVTNIVKKLTGARAVEMDMGLPLEKREVVGGTGEQNWVGGMGNMSLAPFEVKIGKEIKKDGGHGDRFVIIEVLDTDGYKFKAIKVDTVKELAEDAGIEGTVTAYPWSVALKSPVFRQTLLERNDVITEDIGSAFVAQPHQTQLGIEITPEIKAKIKGEAPDIKASGKKFVEGSLPMFKKIEGKGEPTKTLLIAHNLSEKNLVFSDKLGGIVNPSMAVIDVEKSTFGGYGEISLIPSPEIIDRGTKRGVKTYAADVYSPRFPKVSLEAKEGADDFWKEKNKAFFDVVSDPTKYPYTLHNAIDSTGNLDSAVMSYMFLKEAGQEIDQTILEKEDPHDLRLGLARQIRDADLSEDYRDFYENVTEDYIDAGFIEMSIFNGYTPGGRAKKIPVTLDRISKAMNSKSARSGENYFYGTGSIRAQIAPELASISQIKKESPRIVETEKFQEAAKQMSADFQELIEKVGALYKFPGIDNVFIRADNIAQEFGLYLGGKKRWADAFTEAPIELQKEVDKFRARLKAMPTEYFEASFSRPVNLSEFSYAVIPDTTKEKTRSILKSNGVEVFEYKKTVPGDRSRVVQELASADTGGKAAFQKIPGDEAARRAYNKIIESSQFTELSSKLEEVQSQIEIEFEISEVREGGVYGYGADMKFIGNVSTFPGWITKESGLRDKKLMDLVWGRMQTGEALPGSRQQELRSVIEERILSQLPENLVTEKHMNDWVIEQEAKRSSERSALLETIKGFIASLPTQRSQKGRAVKSQILDTTGQRQDSVAKLLKAQIRAEARTAKVAIVAGRKQVREQLKKDKERQNVIKAFQRHYNVTKRAMRTGKGIDLDYQKKIMALFAAYDFSKMSNATRASLEKTQTFFEGQEGEAPQRIASRLERLSKSPLGDMTTEQITELDATITEMIHLGKVKFKLKQRSNERTRQGVLNKVVSTTVNPDVNNGPLLKLAKTLGIQDPKKVSFDTLEPFRVADVIDGYRGYNGGNFTELVEPMREAVNQAHLQTDFELSTAFDQIQELAGEFTPDQQKRMIRQSALDQGGEQQAAALVAAYPDVDFETPLTTAEQGTLDIMRDAFKKVRTTLAATFEAANNREFPNLDNYFPFKYSKENVFDVVDQPFDFSQTKTAQGFTISRTPGVGKVLDTDIFSVFSRAISEQLYYANVQPQIDLIKSIVNDPVYQKKAGVAVNKFWKTFIEDVARRGNPGGWFDMLRGNISTAVLGYKLTTILIQPLAVVDAMGTLTQEFGITTAMKVLPNLAKMTFSYNALRAAKEESSSLGTRAGGQVEISDIENLTRGSLSSNKFVQGYNIFKRHAFDGIQAVDMRAAAAVYETFKQAYLKKGMNESEAIRRAEQMMILTQASSNVVDRSHLFNTTLGRGLLTFQTFVANAFNNVRHDIIASNIANKGLVKGSMKALWALQFVVYARFLEEMFRDAFFRYWYGADDDEEDTFASSAWEMFITNIPILNNFFGFEGEFLRGELKNPIIDVIGKGGGAIDRMIQSRKVTIDDAAQVIQQIASVSGVPGSAQMMQLIKADFLPIRDELGFKDYQTRSQKIKAAYEDFTKKKVSEIMAIDQVIVDFYKGEGASDQVKNNIRKEFAVYKAYGLQNEYANSILKATSNADKLDLLKEARQDLGQTKFSSFYKKGRSEIKLESGSKSPILISDNLNKDYKGL